MSTYSVGGWMERSAVLLFDTLFLFSLLRAYLYMKRGDLLLKAMANSSDSHPAWNRGHSSCDGSFLCDRSADTSSAAAVFRDSVLDWIFNEHFARRAVASASQVLESSTSRDSVRLANAGHSYPLSLSSQSGAVELWMNVGKGESMKVIESGIE
jgi:hypothetical protein